MRDAGDAEKMAGSVSSSCISSRGILRLALLIFLLALFLRAGWIFESRSSAFLQMPHNDHVVYLAWGDAIARSFPVPPHVSVQQPAYAYFLALLSRLGVDPLMETRLVHAALGSFTVMILFLAASTELGVGAAVMGAVMYGAMFAVVLADTTWSKESLAMCLLAAGILGIHGGRRAGIAAGISCLLIAPWFRDSFAFPAAAAAYYCIARHGMRARGFLAAILILLMLPASSILHGAIRDGRPTAQGLGFILYTAFHPDASVTGAAPAGIRNSRVFMPDDIDRESQRRFGLRGEEANQAWAREALRQIATHPARSLNLVAARIADSLWGGEIEDNYPVDVLRARIRVSQALPPLWLLITLGLGGSWIWFRSGQARATWNLLGIILLSTILPLSFFFVADRLRLPALFAMALHAAGGIRFAPGVRRRHLLAYGIAAVIALNPVLTELHAEDRRRGEAQGWLDLAADDYWHGYRESALDGFRRADASDLVVIPPDMRDAFQQLAAEGSGPDTRR